jgi:hypothetical protein
MLESKDVYDRSEWRRHEQTVVDKFGLYFGFRQSVNHFRSIFWRIAALSSSWQNIKDWKWHGRNEGNDDRQLGWLNAPASLWFSSTMKTKDGLINCTFETWHIDYNMLAIDVTFTEIATWYNFRSISCQICRRFHYNFTPNDPVQQQLEEVIKQESKWCNSPQFHQKPKIFLL